MATLEPNRAEAAPGARRFVAQKHTLPVPPLSDPKPIRIGFGSLKGGTGKSTLAEITASYLCYTEGLRLFVVDCDYLQYSFFGLRERDKQTVQNGEPALQARMKKHFEALGREAYRVIKSTAARAERG